MIRITETTEGQRRVFRIDGRLTAEDVPVLDERCTEAGRPYVLDIRGLRLADAVGSERLREFASSGVRIRGVSPYRKLLLEDNDKG
jgi:hypothetical protein